MEGERSPRPTSLYHLLVLLNLEMWLLVTLGDALFSDISVKLTSVALQTFSPCHQAPLWEEYSIKLFKRERDGQNAFQYLTTEDPRETLAKRINTATNRGLDVIKEAWTRFRLFVLVDVS